MKDGRARSSGAPFTVRMTYNGRHQVVSVEYPPTGGGSNPTIRYEYDAYGNCTAITNELGHRSTYTYDSYRRCTSYTEPLNAPGWNGTGTVVSRRWDWIYDRWVDGLGLRGASTHTSREWRVQVEPAFNATGERRMTARSCDVNNRITFEQTGWIQPPGEIGPNNPWYQGPDLETHRFTYDENGQKSSFTDPRGRVTTYGYDNRNRLETTTEPKRTNQPQHPVTRIAYDVAGNKRMVTFPDTRTQKWDDYDAFGQAWKFTSERNHETHLAYQWGPMKKLAQVTTHRDGENQPTTFTYDWMGRPEWTIFPDTSSELSAYELGQLSAFKTRRNQTKRLHYDARGREIYHTWDADAAPRIDRLWDDANRLTRIANLWSTIEYEYDAAGQAKFERSHVVGSNGPAQVNYLRYPSGEVSRTIYPTGTSVDRFYTARGQLKDVGWGAGATSYVYHPDGKVNSQFRTNGVTTSYEYDGRGMIGSLRHSKDGRDLAKRDYWRDDRDRILAWKRGTDNYYNGMEDGRGSRYRYDEEGQLTSALYRAHNPETETPSGEARMDSFVYDQMGNRRDHNHVANRGQWMTMTRREGNGLNQYHSWHNQYIWPDPLHWGTGVFHDDNITPPDPPEPNFPYVPPGNGVLMQDGWITAGFNALNQPTAMWSKLYAGSPIWMFFGYDPLGRCVKRWKGAGTAWTPGYNPATYFYYDGWNLVQEGATNAAIAERVYVHGGRVDEIVASNVSGLWYNHHYDAQGNCILLSTATGGLAAQFDYDAFGYPYFYNATGGKGVALTRFLFTGREWINDMRLYDYRHRMYQPELGRFLQPDPKHFAAGDYNIYRYCHNDPINHTDPTGLSIIGKVLRFVVVGAKKGDKIIQELRSMKDSVRAQKEGEDVVMKSEKLAREVAKRGGDGASPIKEVDKATGRPHYHDANRAGGHVMWGIAEGLTIAGSLPQDSGAFERGGAFVLDLFNPLSLPLDVLEVYDAIKQPVQ